MSQDIKHPAPTDAAEQPQAPISLGHGEQPDAFPTLGAPKQKDTYQDLERKYRHRTYQAQELMIEKLLRGFYPQHQEVLERKLSMFDLHFSGGRYMVVLVRPAGSENLFTDYASSLRDGGQVGLIVSSIFSELLGEHFGCHPANLDDRYAFLLSFGETDDTKVSATVASVCRDAVKFIHDNFTLDLKVCVSGICEDFKILHDMFRETDRVSGDSNTVFTAGVCVRAESIEAPDARRPEPSIEKQYLNALVTQDFQTALQLTLERIRGLAADASGNMDLERIKMFLDMRMHTTGNVLSAPLEEILMDDRNPVARHRGESILNLDGCNTLEDVEKAMKDIFNKLDAHFNTAPSDYTGTTGKVIHLISKKYMEPDLSVEMICDQLGKSRSYLSRMFKENTGMNLLDYLHTTRLTEAKKLLNETDLGISEIAAKVGYYSGWTLARVFKRYEGITPTAYRKAFCGNTDA